MASPEAHEEAVSFGATTPAMDDHTIRQTPCPRAASTNLRTNVPFTRKLYESLSFSTPPSDDADQSSLGVLPGNFDASLMNFAHDVSSTCAEESKSILQKSRKHSTLPSIPESPNKMPSEEFVCDDVFEDNKEVAGQNQDKKKNQSEVTTNLQPGVRFSISNLSKISFRDDQISARSSTADSYLLDKSLPSSVNGTKPGTFSHLLSKHTLDVSAYMDALPALKNSGDGTSALKTVVASCANSHVEENLLENSKSLPDEDVGLKYFKRLGESNESFNNFSTNSGEFVSGGNLLAILKDDEEAFNKDTELLIPENAFGNGTGDLPDPSVESALRNSWLSVNRQDITRPSWVNSEDNIGNASRLTIGEFIRIRTECLGIEPGQTAPADIERPNFGISTTAWPSNSDVSALLPQPPTIHVPQAEPMASIGHLPGDIVKEGIMSNSAISLFLSDVPTNPDSCEFINRLIKVAIDKRGQNPVMQPSTSNDTGIHNDTSIDFSSSILPGMSESLAIVPRYGIDKSVRASTLQRSSASVIGDRDNRSCSPQHYGESFPSSSAGLKLLIADQGDFRKCIAIPREVSIYTPCCVETSVDTFISMNNSSPHWLEGSVRILQLRCNGENVNVTMQPPIIKVESTWTMQPSATHYLNVALVLPKRGIWEAVLEPFFRHISSSSRNSTAGDGRWCPFPPVVLKATAEDADLSTSPAEVLDFGILPEECLTVSHVMLTNNSQAQLPVRLVIEGSPTAGQGFYFPQENLDSSWMLRGSSSCISKCVLGKTCPIVKVPVAFKAPTFTHADHGMQTVLAFLRIELEIPGPAPILKKVALKAFVCPVKLCTLPENETIELTYPMASSRQFPLANASAIPLNLELFTDAPQDLTVVPVNVELLPNQEIKVQVLFHPTAPAISLQSYLKIKVIPEGSVYKIAVVGNLQSRPRSASSSNAVNQTMLESNLRYVYWGAVGLGCNVQRELGLRNVSPTESLYLYLKIKPDNSGCDASPFQLIDEGFASSSGTTSAFPGSRPVLHLNVTLSPLESKNVKLNFVPGNPGQFSAILVIRHRLFKQHAGTSSAPRVKFHVPLRGFGGVSLLVFSGLQQTKMPSVGRINVRTPTGQYPITTSEPNNTIQILHFDPYDVVTHFSVRNCGQQAAFVKIVASSDKTSIAPLPNWLSVIVQPSEFVLDVGNSDTIKLTINQPASSIPVFYLLICYGENILRHRFCQLAVPLSDHPEDVLLCAQLKLQENFLMDTMPRLAGGQQWPICPLDRTRLIASLKLQCVLVQQTPRDSPFQPPSLRLNSASSLEDNSCQSAFFPLQAEVTFSDITVLQSSESPSSPPSKEKPSTARDNEGTITVDPTSYNFSSVSCGQSSKFKVTLKSIGCTETVTVHAHLLSSLSPANASRLSDIGGNFVNK